MMIPQVDTQNGNRERRKKHHSEYKLSNNPDADEFIVKVVNRLKNANGNKNISWNSATKIFISEKEGGQTFKPSEITAKRLHDRYDNYLKLEYDFSPMNPDELSNFMNLVESGAFTIGGQIKWKKLQEIYPNRSPAYLKNTYNREKNRRAKPDARRRNRIGGPKKIS